MTAAPSTDNTPGATTRAALLLFCSFVCFVATLPIYSPNIVALNHFQVADVTAVFARTVIASSLVAALALCAATLRRSRSNPAQRQLDSGSLATVASVLYFLGCCSYIAVLAFGVASPLADVVCFAAAVCAGLGLLPLCIRWASNVRGFELRQLIAFAGLGFLAASLANLALQQLPSPTLFVVHAAFLAVAAFSPLAANRTSEEPVQTQVETPQLKSYLSVMGVSLMGIAISSFVIGVAPVTVFDDSVDTQAVGVILAGVVTLPFVLIKTKTPTNILMRQAVVPIAAVLTLAVCAFPSLGDEPKVVASYALLSLIGAVALGTATAISNAREFPRELVFASLVGTYSLAAAAGLTVGYFLADATTYHSVLVIVLAIAFCAFAVCVACASSLAKRTAPTPETEMVQAEPVPSGGDVEACIEHIAARYGLTPREREILGILARGHSCSYVADTLLISINTVYTHTRNAYRKLDISSHDDLIQLIDRER